MWIDQSNRGRLIASDRDRIDLLNRLTTNKLTTMQPGQLRMTVFTNANARIIDAVTVMHGGDQVYIVTGEGRGELIANWLRRNVFFNDRFQLEDVSDHWQQLAVFGNDATLELARHWQIGTLEAGHFLETDDGVLIANTGHAYWVLGDKASLANFKESSEAASTQDYEAWRVQQGIPSATAELTTDYIPLEVGLWDAVNFNKGCYTGQEIIARMESRGKLAKMLVKVTLDRPLPDGTALLDPDGKTAGTLTSVAQSGEQIVGLAVVKAPLAQPGQILVADGHKITVEALAGTYEADYS